MYKRILVPLDGSDASRLGLDEAIGLAQPLNAKLLLLHILDDLGWLLRTTAVARSEELRREVRTYGDRVLAEARDDAAKKGVEAETMMLETVGGNAADAIVAAAGKQNVDLIVMGTHGRRGLSRVVLGSDAMSVLHASPVPVLLVRAMQPHA